MFSVHFSRSNDAKQPHLHLDKGTQQAQQQPANHSPESPSTSESP